MKRAGGAALMCLAVVLACDDSAPPRRPQGISEAEARSRSAPPPKAAPDQPSARSQLPSPFQETRASPGAEGAPAWGGVRAEAASDAGPGTGAALGAGQSAGADTRDAGAPTRDLAGELRALLEPVASCLDAATVARAGGKLTVTAVAHLVSSGRVSRVSVSAPGQPNEAVRCLEERVSRSALPGPIPGAPLSVTVTVPIEAISAPASR